MKTSTGALVSLIAGAIMLTLFASELSFYLQTEVKPELFVDTSRNEKLRINLDLVFPEMPCSCKYPSLIYSTVLESTHVYLSDFIYSFGSDMSLDVMDISGAQQFDVEHNVYRRRLNKKGVPIDEAEKHDIVAERSNATDESSKEVLDPDRCESCYGAETKDLTCCNTCEKVREAYRLKGWAFGSADGIVQCEREGWSDNMKAVEDEGCNIYGFLLVNKVAGNFHFAPGKSFQQHSVHIHDMQPFGKRIFNMSHYVKKISFGSEYPGYVLPFHLPAGPSSPLSVMIQARNIEAITWQILMYPAPVHLVWSIPSIITSRPSLRMTAARLCSSILSRWSPHVTESPLGS